MKFGYFTEWETYVDRNYKEKKRKKGYTIYVTGKLDETDQIDKVCDFMSRETGYRHDRFIDGDIPTNYFFLELYERDVIDELKESYKMGKRRSYKND